MTWYTSIYQGFRCLVFPFGSFIGRMWGKKKGFDFFFLFELCMTHKKHLYKKILWGYCSELGHRHPWVQSTLCAYEIIISRCVLWGGKHRVTLNIESQLCEEAAIFAYLFCHVHACCIQTLLRHSLCSRRHELHLTLLSELVSSSLR